jgi:hypothetical protein
LVDQAGFALQEKLRICLHSSLGRSIGGWGSDTVTGGSSLSILLGRGSSNSWGAWVGICDVDPKARQVNVTKTPDKDSTEDGC